LSRAIVNVATGPHVAGQERLRNAFRGEALVLWTDKFPPECPPHRKIPYAFKAWALSCATPYHDVLLWLDASMIDGPRPLSDLWEKIEREGYYLGSNGFCNSEWTRISTLPELFPEMTLGEAIEVNKTIPHCVAGVIGLDLRHEIARNFLDEYFRLANTRAFCGPWAGPIGVRHRHDQTAASVIAWRLGMELSDPSEWFSYLGGETEKTCVVAKGL
jgi:hypothetical protein